MADRSRRGGSGSEEGEYQDDPHSPAESRIYIGNLPQDIQLVELKDVFSSVGEMQEVSLMRRRRDCRNGSFAFISFRDSRDARAAIRHYDGYLYNGCNLVVEMARNKNRAATTGFRNVARIRSRFQRTAYRVTVSGIPSSGSWQDLKDHMRDVGEVCYADVFDNGKGIVEFRYYEDMMAAVKQLDGSRFRSHEGDKAIISVELEDSSDTSSRQSRSRSRSPWRGRGRRYSRSRSYSPPRRTGTRSRSRSRSRSSRRSPDSSNSSSYYRRRTSRYRSSSSRSPSRS